MHAEEKGILKCSRVELMENNGHGVCLFTSFLAGKHLPGRNKTNPFQEVASAMVAIRNSKELNLLSQTSRSIVEEWDDSTLNKLTQLRQGLPSEAFWNVELLEFYVAFICPDYEIFFFVECEKYLYLSYSPSFSEVGVRANDKTPVFIAQRERDLHCRVVCQLDGHYEVGASCH